MNLNLLNIKIKLYLSIFLFCLFCYSTILFLSRDTFLPLISQDGPFDLVGAVLFFNASVLFINLFWNEQNFADPADQQFFSTKTKRIWFLLLAFLFLFLMGEEVRWGQGIFGYGHFPNANVNAEHDLHGLLSYLNESISKQKDTMTVLKIRIAMWFTSKKIFFYFFISFLVLLPLSVRFISNVRNFVKKFYIPVPPIELGILFIINKLLFNAFKPLHVMYDGVGRGLSEIQEFNFAFILFMVPFVWLMNRKGSF